MAIDTEMFKPEEKIKLFNKIAEHYFDGNFGSMSKVDLETMLFSEDMDHCIENNLKYDDYTLSKELGITQSRIRSLKERKELKYPYAHNHWKKAFFDASKNAKADKNDKYIKMIIPDVNVMSEVRNYIEEHGWYDECTLNRKLLCIPIGCYMDVFMNASEERFFTDDAKKALDKFVLSEQPLSKELSTLLNDFSHEGLKKFLSKATPKAIECALGLLPFGEQAQNAFKVLQEILEEK